MPGQLSHILNKNQIELIFAKPYPNLVNAASKLEQVDPLLVWALIRQESQFLPFVESFAEAIGFMQIMASTANEVARELNIKILDWTVDGLRPAINIKIGVHYFKRLLVQFDGIVPLALAAYNLGPTKLKAWMNLRTDLSNMKQKNWQSELWIEELPAFESQNYVKSILRNWLVYQVLDQRPVQFDPTFWIN